MLSGATKRATVERMKAAAAAPSQKIGRGTSGQGRGKKTGSDRTRLSRGEAAGYLAARIKRDRPDIAEAVERGEYRSMRQAAIAAVVRLLETYCDI
jgi:hypothetical protein